VPATIKKMFGLPRFLTARDAAANTFDRNFLPSARIVPLSNLRGLVPAARASAPLSGVLSAYQRSLQALAQAIGSPARSAPGGDEAARHARRSCSSPSRLVPVLARLPISVALPGDAPVGPPCSGGLGVRSLRVGINKSVASARRANVA
jgi:hypothetical protein